MFMCETCKEVKEGMKVCSKCKSAYYCSYECQKKAWPEHKITCALPDHKLVQRVQAETGVDGPTASEALQECGLDAELACRYLQATGRARRMS